MLCLLWQYCAASSLMFIFSCLWNLASNHLWIHFTCSIGSINVECKHYIVVSHWLSSFSALETYTHCLANPFCWHGAPMRNVKSLQEALKKMDIAYDSCHEVMSLGALNGYKGELLAEFDVSVDSNLCFKDRQVYIQQHGDQYIYRKHCIHHFWFWTCNNMYIPFYNSWVTCIHPCKVGSESNCCNEECHICAWASRALNI